jgi:hypothetical protein
LWHVVRPPLCQKNTRNAIQNGVVFWQMQLQEYAPCLPLYARQTPSVDPRQKGHAPAVPHIVPNFGEIGRFCAEASHRPCMPGGLGMRLRHGAGTTGDDLIRRNRALLTRAAASRTFRRGGRL